MIGSSKDAKDSVVIIGIIPLKFFKKYFKIISREFYFVKLKYLIEPGESVHWREDARRQLITECEKRIVVAIEEQFNGRFSDKQFTFEQTDESIKTDFEPERLVAEKMSSTLLTC